MDIMNDKDTLILIAPYDDLAIAHRDFASLAHQVHQNRFQMPEAVLVTKNAEGHPEVLETIANHARTGAGWGAGIGILFGLLIPPFGASVAVGAAAGALVAKFADHKSGLRHEVGEALTAGIGVVLAMLKPEGRSSVERALPGATGTSVLALSDATIASLEAAVAEAMTTADPDHPQPVAP
jgi:uncharacterized membrane protein